MRISLAEVDERGLHIDRTGHITDQNGNEYRDEGEACWIEDEELITLLQDYIAYVDDYPNHHDEGSYPACFEEWFMNDGIEGGGGQE